MNIERPSFDAPAEIIFVNVDSGLPVGIKYLMAFLISRGVRVQAVDIPESDLEQKLEALEKLRNRIIFAFSCYTPQIKKILQLVSLLKKRFPDSKVVLGNIHATACYRELLHETCAVDFVVLGEGEIPMLDIVEFFHGQRKLHQVRNVAYRDELGRIHVQEDKNALVDLNDVSIVDIEKIRSIDSRNFWPWVNQKGQIRMAVLTSSRGCPLGCSYCTEILMTKGRWRGQAPEVTLKDMEELAVNGIRFIHFTDPCFNYDRSRVMALCSLLKKKKLQLEWGCYVHPAFLNPEMVQAMGEAGCRYMLTGIDCGHAKIEKKYRKFHLDFRKLKENIRIARKHKIFFKINLIIGWPEETLGDVICLGWRLLKLHATHFSVMVLLFVPGAKLFNDAVSNGQIQPDYGPHCKVDYYRSYHIYSGFSRLREILRLIIKKVILELFLLLSCRSLHGFYYYIDQNLRGLLLIYKRKFSK